MNTIKRFETISRHNSKLAQSPATIKCLTDVLKYIKYVLDDDTTQTLFELIDAHMNEIGNDAHKLNYTLLTNFTIDALYQSFVNKGYYDGPKDEMIDWMIFSYDIYDIPNEDGYDDLYESIVSLRVMLHYINKMHDSSLYVHDNQIANKLDNLMSVNHYSPCVCVTPESVYRMLYKVIDKSDFAKVLGQLNIRLAMYPPSDPIIDYETYEDRAEIPFDTSPEIANFLTEYGETTEIGIYRKFMDYYYQHQIYLISSTMTPQYATTLMALRSNINSSYTKVLNVFTVLNKINFAIEVRGNINFLSDKTLDLINLTGLSKSFLALSLVPYTDGYNNYMKLVVSFDNYRTDLTGSLIDPISIGDDIDFSIVINVNRDTLSGHVAVNDSYYEISFPNINKQFDIDPHYLFICPNLAYKEPGTIRLSRVYLYNNSLELSDIQAITHGFNQRG